MELHIDLYSVAIAAVLFMVISFCWYSKWLFGSTWLKHSGLKEADVRKNWGRKWGCNFLLGLGLAYFLAFFDSILQVTSVGDAMFSALTIWLGFVVPVQLFPVIWQNRSLKVFFIETAFMLLSLLVMGGIIGA